MTKLKEEYGFNGDYDEYNVENQATGMAANSKGGDMSKLPSSALGEPHESMPGKTEVTMDVNKKIANPGNAGKM